MTSDTRDVQYVCKVVNCGSKRTYVFSDGLTDTLSVHTTTSRSINTVNRASMVLVTERSLTLAGRVTITIHHAFKRSDCCLALGGKQAASSLKARQHSRRSNCSWLPSCTSLFFAESDRAQELFHES